MKLPVSIAHKILPSTIEIPKVVLVVREWTIMASSLFGLLAIHVRELKWTSLGVLLFRI